MTPQATNGDDSGRPASPGTAETVPVTYTLRGVERVRGAGRLVALAVVELDVMGVAITLQGVQVVRTAAGAVECRAPVWRHPHTGKWLPAALLPPDLAEAIAAEVLEASAQYGEH